VEANAHSKKRVHELLLDDAETADPDPPRGGEAAFTSRSASAACPERCLPGIGTPSGRPRGTGSWNVSCAGNLDPARSLTSATRALPTVKPSQGMASGLREQIHEAVAVHVPVARSLGP
jgi:hypothetical protein